MKKIYRRNRSAILSISNGNSKYIRLAKWNAAK